ncbi:MAG TPA: hypothetical protein VHW60_15445 [Caulobacteraceae bacterium]|nr:hypothetical protein [Caulobacteraceae bacterium]
MAAIWATKLGPDGGRPWIRRVGARIVAWLDKLAGEPTSAQLDKRERDWDYNQAGYHPSDAEPDMDRLLGALATTVTDPQRGLSLFRGLAHEGSPMAMCLLGERLFWGVDVPADRAEAMGWFSRARECGSLRGMLDYGSALFWRGELDGAEAVFRQGAERDWAPAIYWVARIEFARRRLKALPSAKPLIERAADLGSPAARDRAPSRGVAAAV